MKKFTALFMACALSVSCIGTGMIGAAAEENEV